MSIENPAGRHRIVLIALLTLTTLPALADKPPHAGGPSHAGQSHYGDCPPGLAKKQNGCLPPGQAKKRYRIGQPLPPEVVIRPLDPDLDRRYGPPPPGYRYGIVDGDIIKLIEGTRMVVEAIDSLSR